MCVVLVATDPIMAKKKRSVSHDFKCTTDGKLVIEEEEPEEMETASRKRRGHTG